MIFRLILVLAVIFIAIHLLMNWLIRNRTNSVKLKAATRKVSLTLLVAFATVFVFALLSTFTSLLN